MANVHVMLTCSRDIELTSCDSLLVYSSIEKITSFSGSQAETGMCAQVRQLLIKKVDSSDMFTRSRFPLVRVLFQDLSNGKTAICLQDSFKILDHIRRRLGDHQIEVELDFTEDCYMGSTIRTNGMRPMQTGPFFCRDDFLTTSVVRRLCEKIGSSSSGVSSGVEITLHLYVYTLPIRPAVDDSSERSIHGDVIITAGIDGQQVICQKKCLMACSPVFNSMLTQEPTETVEIEIGEMTKSGVTAMLDYIYSGDLSRPNTDCVIAYELLFAATKYRIDGLKLSMTELLIAMPLDWFHPNPEIALEMLNFAHNDDQEHAIVKKAISVIKRYMDALRGRSLFAHLCRIYPELGMPL